MSYLASLTSHCLLALRFQLLHIHEIECFAFSCKKSPGRPIRYSKEILLYKKSSYNGDGVGISIMFLVVAPKMVEAKHG